MNMSFKTLLNIKDEKPLEIAKSDVLNIFKDAIKM